MLIKRKFIQTKVIETEDFNGVKRNYIVTPNAVFVQIYDSDSEVPGYRVLTDPKYIEIFSDPIEKTDFLKANVGNKYLGEVRFPKRKLKKVISTERKSDKGYRSKALGELFSQAFETFEERKDHVKELLSIETEGNPERQ